MKTGDTIYLARPIWRPEAVARGWRQIDRNTGEPQVDPWSVCTSVKEARALYAYQLNNKTLEGLEIVTVELKNERLGETVPLPDDGLVEWEEE